jgi:peptide/nickel transport system substrate-binding protein
MKPVNGKRFGRPLIAAATFLASIGAAEAGTTLRVVMHSDLKILDPVWTPAYITRNHGYMIYDTLLALDEKGEIKPQMLQTYEVSRDGLTYTFTLRSGLIWHDGRRITSEDCIASIKRWAAKDPSGQILESLIESLRVVDALTFEIKVRQPTALLLVALGKPSNITPFMMPKRVAETDPNVQISDYTGSGPFVFKKDEWKPGDKTVYLRFDGYKPRPEPASGLAGGKVVKVDRVEWRAISDHQQAVNALLAGEIDFVEAPPHDLHPLLAADRNVRLLVLNPLGSQNMFRPNHLHKPFDNPKLRRALWYAFNQEDFLKAVVGNPTYYQTCKALFVCGTTYASDIGMDGLLESNFDRARALLEEAGYDGTPVVLLQSTDLFWQTNLAPVARNLMERAGFKVDMRSMDWQSIVARRTRKEPPEAGGWNAFLNSPMTIDLVDPVRNSFLNAGCEKAPFGWPCDAEIEKLRREFAHETDPVRLKAIAEAVQVRATEVTPYVPLGEWYLPSAARKDITGFMAAGPTVFWNVERH